VAADEVVLQGLAIGIRNPVLRHRTEAGIDAVNELVLGEFFEKIVGALHFGQRGFCERDGVVLNDDLVEGFEGEAAFAQGNSVRQCLLVGWCCGLKLTRNAWMRFLKLESALSNTKETPERSVSRSKPRRGEMIIALPIDRWKISSPEGGDMMTTALQSLSLGSEISFKANDPSALYRILPTCLPYRPQQKMYTRLLPT